MSDEVLALKNLHAWYGESHVLQGVDFQVRAGEAVTLLGRNGAGRTSTLRAVLGLTGRRRGSVRLFGQETIGMATHRIARLGVGYCPEERGIFASLTCEENLRLPPHIGDADAGLSLDEIYALFPNLAERRHSPGMALSGGEQQMLALARILRTGARLLLLDEISEGLAPVIVDTLREAIQALRERGYTIVLVEQNFHFAAGLCDRLLFMEHGRLIESLAPAELDAQAERVARLLSV
ncbi:ABC transporter ATP-binding protein [Alloalcanivorax xenomutans]|nr:ABC transporter ATP-binding protein [Alloalcanivorax xenomutans]WOA33633.1 ABC transporter ATP-binding protein [Alloalcanivorax xenomutans]